MEQGPQQFIEASSESISEEEHVTSGAGRAAAGETGGKDMEREKESASWQKERAKKERREKEKAQRRQKERERRRREAAEEEKQELEYA